MNSDGLIGAIAPCIHLAHYPKMLPSFISIYLALDPVLAQYISDLT